MAIDGKRLDRSVAHKRVDLLFKQLDSTDKYKTAIMYQFMV